MVQWAHVMCPKSFSYINFCISFSICTLLEGLTLWSSVTETCCHACVLCPSLPSKPCNVPSVMHALCGVLHFLVLNVM